MSPDGRAAIVRQGLADWDLYDESAIVQTAKTHSKGYWIGYADTSNATAFTAGMRIAAEPPTYFDLNVIDGVLYILFVQIEARHRGKGHGDQLYKLLIALARQLGCRQIRQTPSGGCIETGESRMEYLVRRGWIPEHGEVYQNLGQEE